MFHQIVRARVRPGAEDQIRAQRPALLEAMRARFPDFVDAQLVELDDGTWLDLVTWRSREAAEQAMPACEAMPEHRAMDDLIEEVVSFDQGEQAVAA